MANQFCRRKKCRKVKNWKGNLWTATKYFFSSCWNMPASFYFPRWIVLQGKSKNGIHPNSQVSCCYTVLLHHPYKQASFWICTVHGVQHDLIYFSSTQLPGVFKTICESFPSFIHHLCNKLHFTRRKEWC